MILQMAFSIHYQDETFCKTYQPTAASDGGTSVYDQLPFHVSSCIKVSKKGEILKSGQPMERDHSW